MGAVRGAGVYVGGRVAVAGGVDETTGSGADVLDGVTATE